MIKKLIKNILRKAGYKVSGTKYILKQFLDPVDIIQLDFDHVLSKYLLENPKPDDKFYFLQIGAFDGLQCDPLVGYLERFDWNGILLEPQPEPYIKLTERYRGRSRIVIRNAAIDRTNGKTVLYTVKGEGLPEWAKGMASFNKQNILKHDYMFPGLNNYVRETQVDTITFQQLFADYEVSTLDLLQIDTEGFDAELLRMFPFSEIKPKLIHFESKHITKHDLEKVLDELISFGYKVARDGEEDMIAVLYEK